eukprot:6202625-Pleurochrysis_carterae.AAC.3
MANGGTVLEKLADVYERERGTESDLKTRASSSMIASRTHGATTGLVLALSNFLFFELMP